MDRVDSHLSGYSFGCLNTSVSDKGGAGRLFESRKIFLLMASLGLIDVMNREIIFGLFDASK